MNPTYSRLFQPSFDISKFAETFDTNLLRSILETNWPDHHAKIQALKPYAAGYMKFTSADRTLVSNLCAHAAWAIHAHERKAGRKNAELYIQLGALVASYGSDMARGYIKYVHSAILRGNDQFNDALAYAKLAIALFREEPNIDPAILAHTYNQAGLAALRLADGPNRAKPYFERAAELLKTVDPEKTLPTTEITVSRLLMDAEGNAHARTLMNLAQVYVTTKDYQSALATLTQADQLTPLINPLEIAYRDNIRGECLAGLGMYHEAFVVLKQSYNTFTTQNRTQSQNHLRTLINLAEITHALCLTGSMHHNDEASHYYQEAIALQQELKLSPEHDFTKRLVLLTAELSLEEQRAFTI